MANAASGSGRLEYRDGRVYFVPSGADPLAIGQFEVELPAEKLDRLGFAFGGQPVIFGHEEPLPIVGINVPGGPSFNLLESMGVNVNALLTGQVVRCSPDSTTPLPSPRQVSPHRGDVVLPSIERGVELPLTSFYQCPAHSTGHDSNHTSLKQEVRQYNEQSKNNYPASGPNKRDRDAIPARSRKSSSRVSHKNDSTSTRNITEKSVLSLTQLSPSRTKTKKGGLNVMCGSDIPRVAGLAMDTFKTTADWITKNLGQGDNQAKNHVNRSMDDDRRKLITESEILQKSLLRRRLDRSQRRLMEDHDYYHLRHNIAHPHSHRGSRSPDTHVHGLFVTPRPEDYERQRRGRLHPGTWPKLINGNVPLRNVVCPVSATPVTIPRSKLLYEPPRYTTQGRKSSAYSSRRETSVPPRLRESEPASSPLVSPRCSTASRRVSLASDLNLRPSTPIARPGGVQVPLGARGTYQMPPLADFGAIAAGSTIQTFVEPITIMHPQVGHIDENGQICFNLGANNGQAVINLNDVKLMQRLDGVPGAEIQMLSSMIRKPDNETHGNTNGCSPHSTMSGLSGQVVNTGATFLQGTGLLTNIGDLNLSSSNYMKPNTPQEGRLASHLKDSLTVDEQSPRSPAANEKSQLTQLALEKLAKNEEADTLSVVPGMNIVSEENGKKKMKLPDPTEKRSFRISRLDGTVREVKVISVCENPCIEMIPTLLTEAECDEIMAILDGVNAAPNVPNNLLQATDLTEIQEKALQRIIKRACSITGLAEDDFIGFCPSILTCSAADATEDYTHLLRIYLTEKRQEHTSEFPYLGVSIRPNKGGALRWTCKNEKGFKVARIAHQETFDQSNDSTELSRTVLTAYIK